jgi:hypothetical protein
MQNQPPLTILVMGFCFPLLDLAFFLVVHIGVFVLRQDGKATKAGGKADARPGAHVTPAGTVFLICSWLPSSAKRKVAFVVFALTVLFG